ncbi:M56 family metallopeptidase [Algoriphagus sp.]|uniref:M56 family metallopeptidase n=1 Tax=Algoriphagus sp. TaxID=1872435 RepID=UPI0025FF3F7C|nr:M56 family metallopeptidase [Algoriphagus sp.]
MEYLLKSMLCLVILLLIHRIFLQREAMHQFNRFYLLLAVVFSFLIPFNSIEVAAEKEEITYSQITETGLSNEIILPQQSYSSENFIIESNQAPDPSIPWNEVLWSIYSLITLVLLIRFIKNIKVLMDQVQQNLKVTYKGMTLVLLTKASLPYTFLKYVFVPREDFENGNLADAIIEHEYTHVKEGHSYDILFIELLLIPFWFHPGLYMAKQAIRLNHEFIADQKALKTTSLYTYQKMLLALASQEFRFSLVSNLNFSLTKKRLKMMNKQSNPFQKWIKLLIMIPVLGAMVYLFSEKVVADQEADSLEQNRGSISNEAETTFTLTSNGNFIYQGDHYDKTQISEILEKISGPDLLVNILANPDVKMGVIHDFQQELRAKDIRRIKHLPSGNQTSPINKDEYYKNVTFTIVDKDGQKEKKSYDELPDNLKADLINPPTKPSFKIPENNKFEEWKNSEKFALWIDGKVITNDALDTRKAEEFVYYFESFVHNNARSEKFPQPFQVSLFTVAGFENSFGEDSGFGMPYEGGMTIYLEDSEKWPPSVKKEEEKSLTQNFNELNTRYEKLRNAEPHFVERSESEQQKLLALFSELGSMYFRIPLELKQTANRPIHPFHPYIKLTSNGKAYYKLKENLTAEERSQLPPPPAKDKVSAYHQIFMKYELMRQEGRNYSYKSQEDRERMYQMYNELQDRFLAMNAPERRQVKMVNFPFIPLEEDGELVFKVLDEMSPEQRALNGC